VQVVYGAHAASAAHMGSALAKQAVFCIFKQSEQGLRKSLPPWHTSVALVQLAMHGGQLH
jgi:hypothetical protein